MAIVLVIRKKTWQEFSPPMKISARARMTKRREVMGMSARGVDEAAGLSPGHTALIESGKIPNPRADTLAAIARVLETSSDWILEGT
jgi:transcriptional regulator with XRE-family HTH domain